MAGGFAFGEGGGALKDAADHALHVLVGVESRVAGQQHVGEAAQQRQLGVGDGVARTVIIVQAVLVFQHVQGGRAHMAALQSGDQRAAVDQAAPGGVDDDHAVLHLSQRGRVDQVVVLGGGVGVQGDDVALGAQGVEIDIPGVLRGLLVGVKVVGQQLAPEAGQVLQHCAADVPGADDAHRAAGQVAADLALQRVVLHLAPLEDVAHTAQAHHHQHDGKVCHPAGRIVHVGHPHPQLAGGLPVHVVVADGAAAEVFHPQLVEPPDHVRAHIAGGHRDGVAPGGQGGVFKVGVRLTAVEFDAGGGGQALGAGALVPRPEGIKEDLHKDCSFPVFAAFMIARFAPAGGESFSSCK